MSGRAIIIVVTGIIIISSVIFYNIEAASTRITANFNDYNLRQSAQNIAQSGVNMSLRQLNYNRAWRTGFSMVDLASGKVSVQLNDTTFMGIPTVAVRSTGTTAYGTSLQTQVTSTAYVYFPPAIKPLVVKGLVTLNGSNQVNGNINIDARDHDELGNLIANSGTYAIWTSGATFTPSGSATLGGTAAGVDYAPNKNPSPAIISTGQVYAGGYPNTPDSAFGGPSAGYTEGTLKAIAQSKIAGSQYVTDPNQLTYPLSGVTYLEMPSGNSTWSPATITGSGILIVHNSAKNSLVYNTGGTFTGILLADDIAHFHSTVIGAIIGLTKTPAGNVFGNGNATIMYSNKAILNATSVLTNGTQPKVVGWWE